tara:strand:- start:149 stop:523 length:375 start_codon:yes stop_codon:yes gene_type:complete
MSKMGELYQEMKENGNWDEADAHFAEEREEKYSVTVTASYEVLATSQKNAEKYILEQYSKDGDYSYTRNVEITYNDSIIIDNEEYIQVADENLWEDGEINGLRLMRKLYRKVVEEGSYILMEKK